MPTIPQPPRWELPTHTCDVDPQPIPVIVRDAIVAAFPDYAEIIKTLRYNHRNNHFYFIKWGMYVGIEQDGYIHT